jgi:uncharacterized protein
MVIDGHVTIGDSRDATLEPDRLLERMRELGIDHALVAPPERFVPVRNRLGNEQTAEACRRSGGALLAYAVATPWLGPEALDELRRAHDDGARALHVDPPLQGFDLLDGQIDPLVAFAVDVGWPIYIRTGTPPHGLPLQVAWLAERFPECTFILGKSGATDFSHDGPATMSAAPNIVADSVYVEWPTALAASNDAMRDRVIFTSDAPFGDQAIELARVVEAPFGEQTRAAVLGGTLGRLLGL